MSLSAVLLAGGESRRMGHDKATMEWMGRPLWEWQLEKLRALRPERVLVSARKKISWAPRDAEVIVDLPPSRGPLSGLSAALGAIQTDYLLALATDLPFMTLEHLEMLCTAARNGAGVVPVLNGKAEPLCAIYPAESRADFAKALEGANYSLQPIVTNLIAGGLLQAKNIAGPMRELYRNVNEPRDLS